MSKQVVVVRTDLQMNSGKMCAQAAHAAMLFMIDYMSGESPGFGGNLDDWSEIEQEWMFGKTDIEGWEYGEMKKIVVGVSSLDALQEIVDAARKSKIKVFTVIDKTLKVPTCCAIGPDTNEAIDVITKHLPLLR